MDLNNSKQSQVIQNYDSRQSFYFGESRPWVVPKSSRSQPILSRAQLLGFLKILEVSLGGSVSEQRKL